MSKKKKRCKNSNKSESNSRNKSCSKNSGSWKCYLQVSALISKKIIKWKTGSNLGNFGSLRNLLLSPICHSHLILSLCFYEEFQSRPKIPTPHYLILSRKQFTLLQATSIKSLHPPCPTLLSQCPPITLDILPINLQFVQDHSDPSLITIILATII